MVSATSSGVDPSVDTSTPKYGSTASVGPAQPSDEAGEAVAAPQYQLTDPLTGEPAVGARGEKVSIISKFDGWGYVRLVDAKTLKEVDAFAIPQALDPAFASGFGAL